MNASPPVTRLGSADVLVTVGGALSEGPLWDPRTERVLWLDIPAGRVHATDVDTGATVVVFTDDGPVGCVALRRDGGFLIGRHRSVATVDSSWQQLTDMATLPGQLPDTRINDGKADPWGAFWVGTLATDNRSGAASLYRLDPDGSIRTILTDVSISNGLGWSPDRSRLYYNDTATRRVDVFDVDSDGDVHHRRPLVEIDVAGASPDGLTVDADGFVWVALWGGGRVGRYTPDGRLDREVLLPCAQVSSVTFAGPDLDVLVITTAYDGLSDSARNAQPLAGSVFVHYPGVYGLAPDVSG